MDVLAQHIFMQWLVREQIIANREELAEQERLLDEIAVDASSEIRALKRRLVAAKQDQALIEMMFSLASCNVSVCMANS